MAKIVCELPWKLREETANEISELEPREEISDWLDAWLDRYEVLLEERIRQLEVVLEKAPDSVNYVRIAGEVEDLWQRASGQPICFQSGGRAAPEEKGRHDRRPPAAAREPTMTGDEARLRFCKRSYTT
jgi:hypothetical protein